MSEEPRLRLQKVNHSFIRVHSDMDVAMELSENFSFDVKGAKFSTLYKMGQWDGKIRLFNLGNRLIPSGLFSKIVAFADARDYTYELIDDSDESGITPPGYETADVTIDSIKQYVDSLNLHARGESLLLREYQYNGVFTGLSKQQCILLSATGSGKSLILYCMSRYITQELDGRVLVLVPTIGLTSQLKSDFSDYSSHNGYDVDSNVHLISGGVEKETKKPIVISTYQSLKGATSDYLNSFTAIITDEGHKITAASFKDIYGKATEVPFRIAMTGTLQDTKCGLLEMEGLTGPVHVIANVKSLQDAGQLVPLKIKAIVLNYDESICKAFKKAEYDDEIHWITSNPKRNSFIKKLAMSCSGSTLILFRFIEQGKYLYEEIKKGVGDTRDVFFIDGSISKEEREEIRLSANKSNAILIFSYATSSLGINLPAIENIIIGHPIKSSITLLQSVGRGLRLKDGKTHCNLFDIGDNMTYKKKVNTVFKHFGERLQILGREGHEFTTTQLNF